MVVRHRSASDMMMDSNGELANSGVTCGEHFSKAIGWRQCRNCHSYVSKNSRANQTLDALYDATCNDQEENSNLLARHKMTSRWSSCKFLGNSQDKYEQQEISDTQQDSSKNSQYSTNQYEIQSKSSSDLFAQVRVAKRNDEKEEILANDIIIIDSVNVNFEPKSSSNSRHKSRPSSGRKSIQSAASHQQRRRKLCTDLKGKRNLPTTRVSPIGNLSLSSPALVLEQEKQDNLFYHPHKSQLKDVTSSGSLDVPTDKVQLSEPRNCQRTGDERQLDIPTNSDPEQVKYMANSGCLSHITRETDSFDTLDYLQQANGMAAQTRQQHQHQLSHNQAADSVLCVASSESQASNKRPQEQYTNVQLKLRPTRERQNSTVSRSIDLAANQSGAQMSKQEVQRQVASQMGDLNGVGSRMLEVCCNTWRSTGVYKVAQQQQQQIQKSQPSSETNFMEPHVFVDTTNSRLTSLAEGHLQREADNRTAQRSSRISRPGRSPISLQRQTNARLARQRLKVQHQRQEQLVRLALRERQLYHSQGQHYNYHSSRPSQASNRQAARLEIIEPEQTGVNSHANGQSIPKTSIFSRLLVNLWQSNRNQATPQANERQQNAQVSTISQFSQNSTQLNRLASNRNQENQRQAHQIIVPIAPSSNAIEICDSQAACSSGQNTNHSSSATNKRLFSATANVIVYRSVDMLRNGSRRENYDESIANSHLEAMALRNDETNMFGEDSDDAKTISSSESSLSLNRPFCKICHLGSSKPNDRLISPCKCSGTMQYIHCGCLLKWLEISNRTSEKPMSCELCAHEYTWHKKFNYKQMRAPKCSIKDVFLHLTFILAMGFMFFCALGPIIYKPPDETAARNTGVTNDNVKTNPADSPSLMSAGLTFKSGSFNANKLYPSHLNNNHLAHDEKYMLTCAAFFFISFFVAVYVQAKARDTLYGLLVKFITMNQTYYITEYDHGGQLDGNNSAKQEQVQPQDQAKIWVQK